MFSSHPTVAENRLDLSFESARVSKHGAAYRLAIRSMTPRAPRAAVEAMNA
jgi:hypothetical protein